MLFKIIIFTIALAVFGTLGYNKMAPLMNNINGAPIEQEIGDNIKLLNNYLKVSPTNDYSNMTVAKLLTENVATEIPTGTYATDTGVTCTKKSNGSDKTVKTLGILTDQDGVQLANATPVICLETANAAFTVTGSGGLYKLDMYKGANIDPSTASVIEQTLKAFALKDGSGALLDSSNAVITDGTAGDGALSIFID